jgi:hypothetical protein
MVALLFVVSIRIYFTSKELLIVSKESSDYIFFVDFRAKNVTSFCARYVDVSR